MKNKLILSIFICLVFIKLVNGLLISPSSSEFYNKENQESCYNLLISSQDKINLTGNDYWTNQVYNQKDLSKYTKSANDLGITITYQKEIDNLDNSNSICHIKETNEIIKLKQNLYLGIIYNNKEVIKEEEEFLKYFYKNPSFKLTEDKIKDFIPYYDKLKNILSKIDNLSNNNYIIKEEN